MCAFYFCSIMPPSRLNSELLYTFSNRTKALYVISVWTVNTFLTTTHLTNLVIYPNYPIPSEKYVHGSPQHEISELVE